MTVQIESIEQNLNVYVGDENGQFEVRLTVYNTDRPLGLMNSYENLTFEFLEDTFEITEQELKEAFPEKFL